MIVFYDSHGCKFQGWISIPFGHIHDAINETQSELS